MVVSVATQIKNTINSQQLDPNGNVRINGEPNKLSVCYNCMEYQRILNEIIDILDKTVAQLKK